MGDIFKRKAQNGSRELTALEDIAGIPRGNLKAAMADRANWRRYITPEQGQALAHSVGRFSDFAVQLIAIAEYWKARNAKESTNAR